MTNFEKLSPVMLQYLNIKEKNPNTILFFRLGDFYEMFFEDAELVARLLNITLTSKKCGNNNKAPMCGVPFHSAEMYISKLVKMGYKVAVCEQNEIVEQGKKRVLGRDVVKIVTAGTITNNEMLDGNQNNFIACVCKGKNGLGIAYSDITTGEFFVQEYEDKLVSNLYDSMNRINPAEIICNDGALQLFSDVIFTSKNPFPQPQLYYDWAFDTTRAEKNLKIQFGDTCFSIYELNKMDNVILAAGALLEYLNETQKSTLQQINKITKVNSNEFMILDATARKHLELTESAKDKSKKGTLLGVLDSTKTMMGARLLRNWINQPLIDYTAINKRLNSVEEIYKNLMLRDKLNDVLKKFADIERLTSKIAMQTIMPKEAIVLRNSLQYVPDLKAILVGCKSNKIQEIFNEIEDFDSLHNFICKIIKPEPSNILKDGGYINENFDETFAEYSALKNKSSEFIMKMQIAEQQETGISTLKIRHNSVYGYYIELNRNLEKVVPVRYHRKQTVGNFDRYFTEDLKELENRITEAEGNAIAYELELYQQFREKLSAKVKSLQKLSKCIAEIDCLVSLANVAIKNNYVKPKIDKKSNKINIVEGRHPVIEEYLKDDQFIANDTNLNGDDERIMIITGPNMAGKSTYMRQVALISIMAHIGSFVPAKSAEISIIDRIFTRIGANDDLSSGLSTFMVEMTEMSSILLNSTNNSLIILDEIGRGTSTFDGLSIAWAVLEYFAKKTTSKVLFATHYHELTELEGVLDGVKNYRINVKEINNKIVFLRKIVRGGANRSFGIEVASLAGIPNEIIERAREISHNIDQYNFNIKLGAGEVDKSSELQKINVYNNQIVGMLKDIDVEKITPLGAFEILIDLVKKVR